MPNDYLTLNLLTDELDITLKNARIDKIQQPSPSDIVLGLRLENRNTNLVLSCNSQYARLHITDKKFDAPQIAPSFCMYLRKHILGGRISDVQMLNNDRIVSINIIAKNEMMDQKNYQLIIEVMGRYSNIALLCDNKISDCIKKFSLDDGGRVFMPNLKYDFPTNNKVNYSDNDSVCNLIANIELDSLETVLSHNVSGFAPLTVKQFLSTINFPSLGTIISNENAILIAKQMSDYAKYVKLNTFRPCCIYNSKGALVDFASTDLMYEGKARVFASLNDAIDYYFSTILFSHDIESKRNALRQLLKRGISKTEKRLCTIRNRIADSTNMEKYKDYGDALICNIYRIKYGSDNAVVPNYNAEGTPEITIPLIPQLSVSDNASRYYAKYNKLKRTYEASIIQEKEAIEELSYYSSIKYSIDNANKDDEFEDIKQEFIQIGLIKKINKPQKNKKIKKYAPKIATFEFDGFTIKVGKNNLQNEYVTFTLADSRDIWLHAKNYHGAHTVITSDSKRTPPENVIYYAAILTARFSDAANASKIEIDYTKKKNVKRHPSGKLGLVTYTDFKSLMVDPNDKNIFNDPK